MGVDFTSGSALAQRSGTTGGRTRPSEADEADPVGEEADLAGRRASPPSHPQKKREEDGRLHGVPAVDGATPRRSRSKVGERRRSSPGEDAAAMHTSSPPPTVSHMARGRRRARRGRKEKQQQATLIKADDFAGGESVRGPFSLPARASRRRNRPKSPALASLAAAPGRNDSPEPGGGGRFAPRRPSC